MSFSKQEQTVLDCLKDTAFQPVQPPKFKLKYASVEPGLAYSNTLWDWDSYWYTYALKDVCELLRGDETFDFAQKSRLVSEAAKGNVLNFLDFQEEDGFVPIMLRADHENDTYAVRPDVMNTHKPFLCQSAKMAGELCGDLSWLPVEKLALYLGYYRKNQFDERSGLYFWRDDIMIGGDNNPTVFGRPRNSAADLYLNCFLYAEYRAFAEILRWKGEDARLPEEEGNRLLESIRREMWDEGTGLYYSQDLLVHTYKTEIFHRGLPAFWKSMPLKIKTWGCYLPLLCHIATPQQAQRMVREYFQSALCSDYGIRTVAKDEKMYDLTPSGNPSNWLGAIWTVSNYALFRGFLDYGFAEEALTIKNQTLAYLARDIETHGGMSESYHPDTGEGILHHNFFSWNCLAASMIRESKNI